ncbi:MAG: TetR/AcrR family transcriptional regulator [Lactimicrobium sp.]|jgi:AcrR family transcriptional regulator|uniref:TetR/AcrR family transcriptional regulator n=1 Tax=Lactimicrobium sp. TaxID=2563780 RepID=UPI002F35347D
MYNGNNKTACRSQQSIADALFDLLEEESYEKISITEICNKANVSRQTFYSLFSSKENVIAYQLCRDEQYVPSRCQDHFFKNVCLDYSRYIMQEQNLLAILYENHLLELVQNMQMQHFVECPDFLPDHDSLYRQYAASFIASGLLGIVRIYLENKSSLSEEELADVISDMLQGCYLPSDR